MPSDQDQDIPDLTEWLISDEEDDIDELDLDEAFDGVFVEDDVEIDVAL